MLNPKDALALNGKAARRAVALDDSLAQAHLSMSAAYLLEWDFARADEEILRAIELDPAFAEAYHFRAKILGVLNRQEQAIRVQKRAMQLEPFARPWALVLSYELAGQYDLALQEGMQRLDATPNDSALLSMMYETYRRRGMKREAVQEYV